MMKYAICIRGMHTSVNNTIIDYKKSLENYKERLFKPLHEQGHEVFIFLLTYESPVLAQLTADYNASYFLTVPMSEFNAMDSWRRQRFWHLQSVNMIRKYEKDNAIQFDYILNTRFDLLYKQPVYDNIKYDKINISYKHASGNCDDNFFLFPRQHLDTFESAFTRLNTITHEFCRFVNETTDIHYIYTLENYTTFFDIIRVRV
jgi:hypothetical protein